MFRQDSSCPAVLVALKSLPFQLQDSHLLWYGFPSISSMIMFCNLYSAGLLPVRSPLLRESFLLSFPPLTKMFQFSGFPPRKLCIHLRVTWLPHVGFPHSDICGSLITYFSPQHFAVSRVLLRLLLPRHSPYALLSLTFNSKVDIITYIFFRKCFCVLS